MSDAALLARAKEIHQAHMAEHGDSYPDDHSWDDLDAFARATYLRLARKRKASR